MKAGLADLVDYHYNEWCDIAENQNFVASNALTLLVITKYINH